ncbi:capsular biosynthesis protein [Clostridium botulinum]|uniref:capsular biosynthesis protein n=1 Tax=Clostridium botulinum TaxID=1491 RepID=UPI000947837C|nr:capsular biosynthesis protein [Clostridium botulinum]APQ77019.1 glycosyl transferases group 1 family protein [Clostridium botulinum]
MIKKAIIFGAGSFGVSSYEKLERDFHIEYFCDNDKNKWGNSIKGIKVISPEELKLLKEHLIIVASTYYLEIIDQLIKMDLFNIAYISFNNSFLQYINDKKLNFNNYNYLSYNTNNLKCIDKKISKVLFVQVSQCIRTYKFALVLKNEGVQVDIAYLDKHPKLTYRDLKLPYANIIKIKEIDDFICFLNESDYDIVHSSNEPDYLTNILIKSNKPIIHDSHDMMSLRGDISNSDIIHEYMANKYSAGNIYVDYPIKNYAVDKFNIRNKPILVLNNFTLEEQRPKKYLNKLSEEDGEIHCVYEGGLSNDKSNHRFLEEKFLKIANNNIHVHFYTVNESKYYGELNNKHKYIHWEGVCSPNKLIEEMTRYDMGLVILNITLKNKNFLETTFPNKVFEYLNSSLPIAVDNLPILSKFVNETKSGKVIKFDDNIYEQIKKIKLINISEDFLEKTGFTTNSHVHELLNFYKEVKYGV